MGFKEQLREYLSQDQNFPKELIPLLPRGFQQLGTIAILKLKPELYDYVEKIALAINKLLPKITSVWLRKGEIEGKYRQPKGLYHIWGDKQTEIIIKENNVRYKFDFTKIMFAKGNVHERALLPKKIKKGEIIIDMFTGIGYFSLGMAKSRKPKKIYSIEWNPDAYYYLKENIKLNHVEDIIEPYFGDCKKIVLELAEQGVSADRVIMGLLPAPFDAIESALSVVSNNGTIYVYEGVEGKESTKLYEDFKRECERLGYKSELIERRIVKNYKPHEYHVVIEILVNKL